MSEENMQTVDELAEFLNDAQANDSQSDAADAPSDETPENAPGGETPPEESEPTDADPLDELKRQNEALLARVNELSGELTKLKTVTTAQPAEEEKPAENEDVFGDWTFEKIIEDEENFKRFLSDFAQKIRTKTEESILRKIPTTVTKVTQQQLEVQRKAEEFYAAHPQLAATKPFVAQIANAVAAENPDWDFDRVLQETANRAYNALGLKKRAVSAGLSPALGAPTKAERGKTEQKKSRLEQEIEELLDI